MLAAGPAHAASGVTATGGALRITAQAGKANVFTIDVTNATFAVTDTGDTLAPGAGCTAVDPNTVTCSSIAITSVVVDAGDGDDGVNSRVPLPTTVNGGDGQDRLSTGAGPDVVNGGAGSDALSSNEGQDKIFGGAGNDRLLAGDGNDTLDGGVGADDFAGGDGSDAADYATRADNLTIDLDGTGDDGAAGENDNVRADIESVRGGSGSDTLTGTDLSNRQDTLVGNGGADTLNGLSGPDHMYAGDGGDTLYGGPGHDTLDGGFGADHLHGGGDIDEVTYSSRTAPVYANLLGNNVNGQTGENDVIYADVEDLTGGSAADSLGGDEADNTLIGNGGDDNITGYSGADWLLGGGGKDDLRGYDGADIVQGDAGDDVVVGNEGNDELRGGDGNDRLQGVYGTDDVSGGWGIDTADYSERFLPISADIDDVADDGAPGELDNIRGDVENLYGGLEDDTLIGNDGPNGLNGGLGDDTLLGLGGDDTLTGGLLCNGGPGVDTAAFCDQIIAVP